MKTNGEFKVVKVQFTAMDELCNPSIAYNNDYIMHKYIETGLSKDIISYCYRKVWQISDTHSKFEWIKIEEADALITALNNQEK